MHFLHLCLLTFCLKLVLMFPLHKKQYLAACFGRVPQGAKKFKQGE
jgi:hypothetical protein